MRAFQRLAGRFIAAACFNLAALHAACATPITYDFDAFGDATALTSQYAGLAFGNATVLLSGWSLNEFAFPPASGAGVVFDDGGPIVITFASAVQSVFGRFTYVDGLTLAAYDSANNLLTTATSAWHANVADGFGDIGSSPNELLGVTSNGDLIARVVISSSLFGGSLTLDDLTIDTAAVAVPEPGTLPLVLLGLALALHAARRGRMRQQQD